MQALTFAPAAVAPAAARRSQQVRCQAAPMQQRSLGATPARVGAAAGQRSVAAHAKGAIKPMEATFTEFKLVDKDFKVRRGPARTAAVAAAATARPRLALDLMPAPARAACLAAPARLPCSSRWRPALPCSSAAPARRMRTRRRAPPR